LIERFVLFGVLIGIVVSCSSISPTAPIRFSHNITIREYALLAMAVDSLFPWTNSSEIIVIEDSTQFAHSDYSQLSTVIDHVGTQLKEIKIETFQDFEAKNRTPTYIENPTYVHPQCVHSSISSRLLPHLEISRVGFSADWKQALMYVGMLAGPRTGFGYYVLLSPESGRWKIVGVVLSWIS
jgi:hypothetical protein